MQLLRDYRAKKLLVYIQFENYQATFITGFRFEERIRSSLNHRNKTKT